MKAIHEKFGELLRLERERQGYKLDALAEELKISSGNLESIESGQADQLPSELYFKLFSKSYAEFLGIDYTKTLEAIHEDLGLPMSNGTTEKDKAAGSERAGKKADSSEAGKSEGETDEEDGEAADSSFLKKAITLGVVIIVVFICFTAVYKLFIEEESSPASGAGGSDAVLDPRSAAGQAFAEYEWSTPPGQGPDSLRLTLSVREDSWSTILADGDTVVYKILRPGREYRVAAAYRLLVSVGVPRMVTTTLNGEPAYLINPTSGRISRVEINQANYEQFFTAPAGKRPERTTAAESPSSGDGNDL